MGPRCALWKQEVGRDPEDARTPTRRLRNSKNKGVNRFVWDFQHQGAARIPRRRSTPGRSIRRTGGGCGSTSSSFLRKQTYTERLTIEPDRSLYLALGSGRAARFSL
jgi:hypothetical protein